MKIGAAAFWFLPDETGLSSTIKRYRESQSIIFSAEFLICANQKLFEAFKNQFGLNPIKIKKEDDDIWVFRHVGVPTDIYEHGKTKYNSFLKCYFSINAAFATISICWKSKSGRVYEIFDEEIDCNDIEFWIEDLDVTKVYELLNPKLKLPFGLKNLSFNIEVINLNLGMNIDAWLKPEFGLQAKEIASKTCDFVNKYNKVSENSSKDERGFVHYISYDIEGLHVKFYLDTGSAGMPFLKQLLRTFSRWNVFEKVRID